MSISNPLISIIVTIYNSEKTLYDCLLSISNQTYRNIDVVLVNDGSTDSSAEIARVFCERDSRFKLINQKNSGVAAAREVGLRVAKGDYIIHTDSDDLMTNQSLDFLYSSIKENNSDIAVGSYIKKSKYGGEELVSHNFESVEELIVGLFLDKCHGGLWNKLISSKLCKGLSFEKGLNYMEDKLFLLKVLSKEGVKVSIVDEVVYIYNYTDDSYTNKITKDSIMSSVKVTEKICRIYSCRYSEDFIAHIKNRNRVMVLLNSDLSQRKVFKEANRYILSDSLLPAKHKIILILDLIFLNFVINIYRRFKRF